MGKVRIGLIGVGNVARHHAMGYANTPNAEVYAVCDVNEERVKERAALWGATKTYTDYRDLLTDPNVDAVVPILMLTEEVGVPSFDFILELAEKYPEKPILVTYSGEKRYMDECKAYLEPQGIPTFPEVEQPFEVLSILSRCQRVLNRSH